MACPVCVGIPVNLSLTVAAKLDADILSRLEVLENPLGSRPVRLTLPLTKLGSFTDFMRDIRSRACCDVHQFADKLMEGKLRHKHFTFGHLDQLRVAVCRCVNILELMNSKLLRKSSDVRPLVHHDRLLVSLTMDRNTKAVLEIAKLFDSEVLLESGFDVCNVLLLLANIIKSSTYITMIMYSVIDTRISTHGSESVFLKP